MLLLLVDTRERSEFRGTPKVGRKCILCESIEITWNPRSAHIFLRNILCTVQLHFRSQIMKGTPTAFPNLGQRFLSTSNKCSPGNNNRREQSRDRSYRKRFSNCLITKIYILFYFISSLLFCHQEERILFLRGTKDSIRCEKIKGVRGIFDTIIRNDLLRIENSFFFLGSYFIDEI